MFCADRNTEEVEMRLRHAFLMGTLLAGSLLIVDCPVRGDDGAVHKDNSSCDNSCGDDSSCSIVTDVKRNNCWPDPFNRPERAAVRAPFARMIDAGWQRQNMLADHYFQDSGTELNDAGRAKIRWILTEAPEQHRVVYVRRAESPDKTAARVFAVQQLAAQMMPGQGPPPIMESSASPAGWPAERVDVINRKFQAAIPAPQLSKSQGDNSGASGASSSGSSGSK